MPQELQTLIVKTAIDHAKEKETMVIGEDTILLVLILQFLHAPPKRGGGG